MLDENAEIELNQTKEIDAIDNKFIYHLPPPEICDYNVDYNDQLKDEIKKCRFEDEILYGSGEEKFKILQYKDGGMDLQQFLNYDYIDKHFAPAIKYKNRLFAVSNIINLILNLETLFYGLNDMNKNNFGHFDIKLNNIVINPKTYKMNFIDFGLSTLFNKIKTNNYYNFGVGYYIFPLTTILLNKEHYKMIKDNIKIIEEQNNFINIFKIYFDEIDKYKSYFLNLKNSKGKKIYLEFLSNQKFKDDMINIISNNTYEEYCDMSLPYINVFSFGLLLQEIYKYLYYLYDTLLKDKGIDAPNIYEAIKELTLLSDKMVLPSIKDRITSHDALKIFREKIIPICKKELLRNRIKKIKTKSVLKKIPKTRKHKISSSIYKTGARSTMKAKRGLKKIKTHKSKPILISGAAAGAGNFV